MCLCLLTHQYKYKARCSNLRADAALCPALDVAKKGNRLPRVFCQAPILDITGAHQVQHMLLAS